MATTTLVTVIKADGAIALLRRGTLTAELERSLRASARTHGAEVAGFVRVPERGEEPTVSTIASMSDAIRHPELLTTAQVYEVHAVLAERYQRARVAVLAARASRPSYAPKGRETASERSSAAVLADAARTLAVVEAEAVARGLWS